MEPIKEDAVLHKLSYAGFWKRFWAVLIDGIILALPLLFVRALAASSGDVSVFVMVYILTALAALFYFTLMESSRYQATLGKMALGIVVTDLEGKRISFGRALGRNLGKILSEIILFIGFIIAGFTEKKQALHDTLAKCLVIDKSSVPVQPRPGKKYEDEQRLITFFIITGFCILLTVFLTFISIRDHKFKPVAYTSNQEEATSAINSNAILSNTSNSQKLEIVRSRLSNLATACEIWAREHNNLYPSGYEFLGKEFAQYVKKIGGNENDFYDPLTYKGLSYEIRSDHKYFIIKVRDPEKYGMSELYFDTKLGMVSKNINQADTSRIIPGKSIGGINLGYDWNKLLNSWGQPDKQTKIAEGTMYMYAKHKMNFLVNNGEIDSIYTLNPYHHTEKGVKVGALSQDVIQEFGSGYQKGNAEGLDYFMYYPDKGISFSIIDDKVRIIQVLNPA